MMTDNTTTPTAPTLAPPSTMMPTFGRTFTVTPDDLLGADQRDYWRDQMYQSKILVLKGLVGLNSDQLWDIHSVFGTPWTPEEYKDSFEVPVCLTAGKHVTTYSNIITKQRIGDKSLPWHHDIPWQREKRYPIRSLYPTKLTGQAGDVSTNFCDCDVVWSRLPREQWDELAQADMRLQYWYDASKGTENPATRIVPLVERHPHTKKYSVLLNSFGPKQPGLSFSTTSTGAWAIDCWSRSKHLGLSYLNMLHTLVCTEDNMYEHKWEMGDLVLFDNSSGIFHGRDRISQENVERQFWRTNVKHYWQS